MTGPQTPGEAITQAARRMVEQREAARKLSEDLARAREEAQRAGQPTQEGEPT